MRAKTPIATISYNTVDYLQLKLLELIKAKKIDDYFFVKHFKEKDESKDHIHLFIQPNGLIDTMDLQEHFKEIDPTEPTKTLGCIFFEKSVPDDAVLYFLHDPEYLAWKGQSREYHYTLQDIFCYDPIAFEYRYNHAYYASKFANFKRTMEIVRNGMRYPADLVLSGHVPLQQASQLQALKKMIDFGGTYRGDRKTHTPIEESQEESEKTLES